MTERHFRAMLTARQEEADTLVCVGLDPLEEKIPPHLLRGSIPERMDALCNWMRDIVVATAPFASMFKPQHAHWEAIEHGIASLHMILRFIREEYPEIPVFMDCKRGDIFRTQECYRRTHLENEDADGMNYNGYMGKDTLESLVDKDHLGRALVGLGRTSNPAAWEVQDAPMADGEPLWQHMVLRQLEWSRELGVLGNAGIVMGAAHKDPENENAVYSKHLLRARNLVGNQMWFLIPGFGAQGGFVEATIEACFRGAGTIAMNSSSGIIFASSGEDFAEAAGSAAKKLRDQIREAVADCQKAA